MKTQGSQIFQPLIRVAVGRQLLSTLKDSVTTLGVRHQCLLGYTGVLLLYQQRGGGSSHLLGGCALDQGQLVVDSKVYLKDYFISFLHFISL